MASTRLRYAAVVGGTAVAGAFTLVGAAANAAPPTPVTFVFTGAQQTYLVPAGIHSVQIKAIGAPGGDKQYEDAGGYGAKLVADLAVTPGQTLYVEVGGDGDGATTLTSGWNGGGPPTDADDLAGYGGGASDVQLKPRASATALRSRVVVAGGGGGAGSIPGANFAIVGGNAGADGEPPAGRNCGGPFESGCGGSAATHSAGGAPGRTDTHLNDNSAATAGTKDPAGYPAGTKVTLTAQAKPGSRFAGWSGDCSGRQRCSVTMSKARAVTAKFTAT